MIPKQSLCTYCCLYRNRQFSIQSLRGRTWY